MECLTHSSLSCIKDERECKFRMWLQSSCTSKNAGDYRKISQIKLSNTLIVTHFHLSCSLFSSCAHEFLFSTFSKLINSSISSVSYCFFKFDVICSLGNGEASWLSHPSQRKILSWDAMCSQQEPRGSGSLPRLDVGPWESSSSPWIGGEVG